MANLIKFFIWHILCGAPIIIIIRLVMTIISLGLFFNVYIAYIHFQFMQYALYPFGKKMIYTSENPKVGACGALALIVTIPFFALSYMFHVLFRFVSKIVSCGTLNKYHQYMLDVHNANKVIVIVDENEESPPIPQQNIPNQPAVPVQHGQMVTNAVNMETKNVSVEPTVVSPPQYQSVVPSAPPPSKYEASDENEVEGVNVEEGQTNNGDDEVTVWLTSIGDGYYNDYYGLFMENGYDELKIIKTMSDEDLQGVGVYKMGHRRNMMMEIQKLSNINNNIILR